MSRRRRFWSDDEKRTICRQARATGVSVARVAQRYSMNANLIFKWLRDPRFLALEPDTDEAVFLPVEVSPAMPPQQPPACVSDGRIVIELSGGHRIVAEAHFDADALGRLLKVWRS